MCIRDSLVVLAKFSGEEEFANDVYQGATVAQIIDNTYNRAGYSVRDYFGAISNGKLKMRTLFLLDKDVYKRQDEHRHGGADERGQEHRAERAALLYFLMVSFLIVHIADLLSVENGSESADQLRCGKAQCGECRSEEQRVENYAPYGGCAGAEALLRFEFLFLRDIEYGFIHIERGGFVRILRCV